MRARAGTVAVVSKIDLGRGRTAWLSALCEWTLLKPLRTVKQRRMLDATDLKRGVSQRKLLKLEARDRKREIVLYHWFDELLDC